MKIIKQILFGFILIQSSMTYASNKGKGLKALNYGGFLGGVNYSIAPISTMSPTATPLSMFGVEVNVLTKSGAKSKGVMQFGINGNMSLPSASYMEGVTIDADTINIGFKTRDLKVSLGYLGKLNDNHSIVPYVGLGIGDMHVSKINYYEDQVETPLENAFLIEAEVGANYYCVVGGAFILSLGVSYQMAAPDKLLLNYSSKDLNMLKFNVGLKFGVLQ